MSKQESQRAIYKRRVLVHDELEQNFEKFSSPVAVQVKLVRIFLLTGEYFLQFVDQMFHERLSANGLVHFEAIFFVISLVNTQQIREPIVEPHVQYKLHNVDYFQFGLINQIHVHVERPIDAPMMNMIEIMVRWNDCRLESFGHLTRQIQLIAVDQVAFSRSNQIRYMIERI